MNGREVKTGQNSKELSSNLGIYMPIFIGTVEHIREYNDIEMRFFDCCLHIIRHAELKNRAQLDYFHDLRKHLFLRIADFEGPVLEVEARKMMQASKEEVRKCIRNTNVVDINFHTQPLMKGLLPIDNNNNG
ncbi:unnamed protein product [Ceratitis capitata]|uniref:(Mediterranean fruit fly) hypothetical protein n=1 Tax=Ceratitis capitata TaxID=7213 RepID=A0A811UB95_CERCA|nr:unnamed protein product [Ceratitis capitata]